MDTALYYQSSNKTPLSGVIVASLLLFLATYLLSLLYGTIVTYAPDVFFTAPLTIIYAVVLGYLARIVSKVSLIRSRKAKHGLGFLAGFMGWYFSWIVFIYLLTGETELLSSAYFREVGLIFQPWVIADAMLEGAAVGYRSVGLDGEVFVTIKGAVQWMVWIAEFVLLTAVSYKVVERQFDAPFSEDLHRWYTKYELQQDFERIAMVQGFRQELEAEGVQAIQKLERGEASRHARVSIFYLEKEQHQYLSVINISMSRNGKNRKEEAVAELLRIPTAAANNLIQTYRGKKAFFLDY